MQLVTCKEISWRYSCTAIIYLSVVLTMRLIHQVIAAGYASCTGLSIFLVDALRSVGIPARVAGNLKLSGF